MTKREFIDRLRWFAREEGRGLPDEYGHPDYRASRGESLRAAMLAEWLETSPDVPDDHEVWIRNLPQLVVEAHAEFAVSGRWEMQRAMYRAETGNELPDLVDAFAGGLHRLLVAADTCRLLPLLADAPWLRGLLEVTLGAQTAVVDHAWRRFVRAAYRRLMPRLREEDHRGSSGTFGTTRLLVYELAGRTMFTFRRASGSVTYVADSTDAVGSRSGLGGLGAPYAECVAMIEEVITSWDPRLLIRDDGVGLGYR